MSETTYQDPHEDDDDDLETPPVEHEAELVEADDPEALPEDQEDHPDDQPSPDNPAAPA